MRLATLASVLKRKCGSICAWSARRLASTASRSTRSARSALAARSAAWARASRSRQKKIEARMAEITTLVLAIATIQLGLLIQ